MLQACRDSRFLHLSCHFFYDFVLPNLANVWKSYHIPIYLSISFSVFLFFSRPLLSVSSAFTGPLSLSIFSTCSNHRNLCSLKNLSNLSTPVISRIFSLFILSFKIFPHDLGSTRTLVTPLRSWIRRFTIIISGWWL